MKCEFCGSEVKNEEKFCKYCGKEINRNKQVSTNQNKISVQRRKSNAWLIVGIYIAVIIILIIGISMLNIKDSENIEEEKSIVENKDIEKNETPTTIEFKNYTFTIPSDIKASVSNDQLYIYGPNSEWIGVVMVQQAKYETLVYMKDQIKTALSAQESSENYDFTSAITEEKQYSGKSFLVTSNIVSSTYDLDIAYGKADDDNVYIISITKNNKTKITEEERKKIYSIISSGQKL